MIIGGHLLNTWSLSLVLLLLRMVPALPWALRRRLGGRVRRLSLAPPVPCVFRSSFEHFAVSSRLDVLVDLLQHSVDYFLIRSLYIYGVLVLHGGVPAKVGLEGI